MKKIINEIETKFKLKLNQIYYYYPNVDNMYSLVFSDEEKCLILDFNITEKMDNYYSYSEYVNFQNELMNKYQLLYRFF